MTIRLYNTLTKTIEDFTPLSEGEVTLFVCGPTVYGLSHAGHAKTYVQFDFLARVLSRHYKVRYLQNVTDVDDKIITRASEEGTSPLDLAREYEQAFADDMRWLGNNSVTEVARAHDFIPQIVSQVQRLIDKGAAYELDDGWYFDLTSFPEYGKLSGRRYLKPEDSVSRIDDNSRKISPGDFALWKRVKPGEPSWETNLGLGRPGWHIEDTAITEHYFGPQYDIHGGAVDLIFPHHEAEIAQMEQISGRSPLANYWMHTGLLRVDGAKMAKSSFNFVTIRSLRDRYDFRTLRYLFLSQHYRSSVELSDSSLAAATASRRRVENFYARTSSNQDSREVIEAVRSARYLFFSRIENDLDTPGALAVLFDLIRTLNRSDMNPGKSARSFIEELNTLFDAFDLSAAPYEDSDLRDTLGVLIKKRETLRKQRKYLEADEVRCQISALGATIEDTVNGTRWWIENANDK